MLAAAFDTETELLRPGQMAPALVCTTVQACGASTEIYDASASRQVLASLLDSEAPTIVGHNVAFDLAVVAEAFPEQRPSIFKAYTEDRITDTMIRQHLLDVAAGRYRGYLDTKGNWITLGYTLEELSKRCAGIVLKKTGFRLFYSFFGGVPIARWDEHAKQVQARAAAYVNGTADPEFAKARRIIGEKKWHQEIAGLIAAAPEEARTYAMDDARATLEVYRAQEQHAKYLGDQYRQARAAFALHLSSAWGLRTDAEGVERLRIETQAQYDELFMELAAVGLVRKDGTRDTKEAKRIMIEVCEREGLPLRRTDAHIGDGAKCKGLDGGPLPAGATACIEHVCLDADACNATGDDLLISYAELSTLKKVLSNDVEALAKGTHLPVHTRYGFAETGRTTSSSPNIQNLRRKAGIREAFVPRPGKVFAQADYPQLELYTLAQCCVSWLGKSKLAEALNGGLDAHIYMTSVILDRSYEDTKAAHERYETGNALPGDEDVADIRQLAKMGNFGFPGGMGHPKLLVSIKKQLGQRDDNGALLTRLSKKGLLTVGRMAWLKEQWFAAWPEMPFYLARVNALCDTPDGKAVVETLFTQRTRGGASYCAACNNGFQALGSDCAKNACWYIQKAVYTEVSSPLYNSRLVAFVHDEFIVETEDGPGAHSAAYELARLMVEGANVYLPNVPIPLAKLKPLLMRRWSKKAKQVFKEGRLAAWQ